MRLVVIAGKMKSATKAKFPSHSAIFCWELPNHFCNRLFNILASFLTCILANEGTLIRRDIVRLHVKERFVLPKENVDFYIAHFTVQCQTLLNIKKCDL